MSEASFETMLTGGHPNSLGRTVEVVEIVLDNPERLAELYNCYFSEDEVVRLRTSNTIKRVSKECPSWLVPYFDGLLTDISSLEQASAQWTLANLFETLGSYMTPEQKHRAKEVLKGNLEVYEDWIVLKNTAQTLGAWAKEDEALKAWLKPHLERLSQDNRKAVAKAAQKQLAALF